MENEYIYRHHTHDGMRDNRCSSALVKHIKDPLHLGIGYDADSQSTIETQTRKIGRAQLQVAWQRQLFQTGGSLGGGNGGGIATKVVCLTEVVTADELKDDEEYEDILEDMRVEGGKFGTLMNIVIPRPQPNGEPYLRLGKAFVENYDTSCLSQCLYGIIYHYVYHNRC
ncbi:hypothetical protein C5167_002918 [Papaver somniferum]|uniref:Uncharacterized protein n=1 Tax=Papaver somniferum TaxID=3469 RepID=A0A4Y7L2T6_PAPSO|nr:hypothetical protein C5167_002918 [Papaver somniferum]